MIRIFYNNTNTSSKEKLKLTFANTYMRAEVEADDKKGFDIVKRMSEYNSYAFVDTKGKVKIYRHVYESDYKFLNLNRLGMASKMEFDDMAQLYGTRTVLLVDTGVFSDSVRDINVYLFRMGNLENIEVSADQEYEFIPFETEDYNLNDPKRFELWDGYSLSANGSEMICNHRGEVVMGDTETPIASINGVIDFTITNYKGGYAEKLSRDIDCEEVFIETSAGLADTRRVRLVNGVGKFRLITFGYEGFIKIKLGRKWFSGWNDYALNIK